jgi:hypothetical protein
MHGRVAASTLGILSGCSLLVDQSGLTGGASDDASTESDGATPADAPGIDAYAPSDAPIQDGAGNGEGGDAGSLGCAAAGHDFCDDFDNGALGATWTRFLTQGGTMTLDPVALSPPFSLFLAGADAGGYSDLQLFKDFVGTLGIRCSFDLRVDAYDSNVDLLHVDFKSKSGAYWVRLVVSGGDLNEYGQLPDGGTRVQHNYAVNQPSVGAWSRVELNIQLAGDAGTVTLTVGGVPVTENLSPPADITGNTVRLGAYGVNLDKWRAHFDNFSCDQQR